MAQGRSALEITGLDGIQAGFDQLAAYAEKDVLVGALKSGSAIVEAEAERLAPEKSGRLKKAIRTRVGRKTKGSVSVLAAVGRKWFAGAEFYGGFQEFGWKTGKRGSADRRQVPGEHFMEHAFEEKAAEAMDAIVKELWAGIERELGKAKALSEAGSK